MSLEKKASFAPAALATVLLALPLTQMTTQPVMAFDHPIANAAQQGDHPIVIHWTHCADILSEASRNRISAIQTTIFRQHTISDADLAFALALLRAEPVERKGDNKLTLQCMVLTSLVGRKDVTKQQGAKLLEAIAPYTKSRNSSVAFYATTTLGGLRDARVIPVLEQVAKNADAPVVRRAADRGLPRLKELAKAGAI